MDKFTFTTAGLEYAAQTTAGSVLEFTKGKYGNGSPPDDSMSLTDLVNPLGELALVSKSVTDSTVTVKTSFTNVVDGEILPAFHLTEVGLFARVLDTDGNETEPETLVGYACVSGDDTGDYIANTPTEFVLNWPFSISNTDNVTVSVTMDAYALKEDVEQKVDKTQYASITQAGVIKLHSGSGVNRSGIIVSETDGSAYVATNASYGTQRSGSGTICVAAATESEIDAGSNQYKPIVPNTLSYAVQSVGGDFSDLTTTAKTDYVSALNELQSGKLDSNFTSNGYTGMDEVTEDLNDIKLGKTYHISDKSMEISEHGGAYFVKPSAAENMPDSSHAFYVLVFDEYDILTDGSSTWRFLAFDMSSGKRYYGIGTGDSSDRAAFNYKINWTALD